MFSVIFEVYPKEQRFEEYLALAKHLKPSRSEILGDYHLRVGDVTADTDAPKEAPVHEQRFDETETGAAKLATLTEITVDSHTDPLPLLDLDVSREAADIQLSFSGELASARTGISSYPNIGAWVKRFQARSAYKVALERGGAYSFA